MSYELFSMLNEKFKGRKTYVTAIVAVASAVVAYFSGEATLMAALQLAFTGIIGATLRSSVAPTDKPAA